MQTRQLNIVRFDAYPAEDVLAREWPETIRREDRASLSLRNWQTATYTEDDRQKQSKLRKKTTMARQAKFAAQCTPEFDGDAEIIALYGDGNTVSDVSVKVRRFYSHVRNRLIACHPTAESLK